VFIAFGAFVLIVLIVIISITSPKGFDTNMVSSDYKYKTAGWLQEVARGSKTFRYSKGSALHMQKSDLLISEFLESRTAHFKILTTQYWSLIVFKILIVATMLIAGTWLLLNQQINVGQFIAADIVIILIINSVEKLIATMDNVYDSLTSIEKLSKIVDCKVEDSGSLHFSNTDGCSINFKDVGFVYPNGSVAFLHVEFSLAKNQILCIKGPSGVGRSTVLRLLTGAYTGFSGSILLNQIPIGNYSLKDLRANTGIMLNEQDIFRGSILENLTMGNTDIPMSDITNLADKIGFTDFIISNKSGYDTVLDPTGKRLNESVKQNIKLMRALLGKPTLLLLEKPLEHLNNKQQIVMMNYLRKESNATVIIISNDKDLHEQSDQVLVLENGVIIN
jgi:ATP-binding cassette, subfamily B, bacterial